MPVPDVYRSIDHLLSVEAAHVSIVAASEGRSRIAVLAPHAGRIEPMTGEIARAIAGREHRLYCFLGQARTRNHRLHVTSTRFDEAILREVLDGTVTNVSIHGAAGCGRALTYIGGQNQHLAQLVWSRLEWAGFTVEAPPARLAGRSPRNVVNRAPLGGVQLELTWDLRRQFQPPASSELGPGQRTPLQGIGAFVEAVRMALEEALRK